MLLNEDKASPKDVTLAIKEVLRIMVELKRNLEAQIGGNSTEVKRFKADIEAVEVRMKNLASASERNLSDKWYKDLNREVYKLEQAVKNVPMFDPTQLEAKFEKVISSLASKISDWKQLGPIDIRDILEAFEGDDRLDIKAIRGVDTLNEEIANVKKSIKLKMAGGSGGIQLYVNGVKQGTTKYINFKAGTGVTLTPVITSDTREITITASGGGGFSVLATTGNVDGNNAAFIFASQPSYIVSDGAWYRVNKGWTWNAGALTATMAVPPSTDIFGVA